MDELKAALDNLAKIDMPASTSGMFMPIRISPTCQLSIHSGLTPPHSIGSQPLVIDEDLQMSESSSGSDQNAASSSDSDSDESEGTEEEEEQDVIPDTPSNQQPARILQVMIPPAPASLAPSVAGSSVAARGRDVTITFPSASGGYVNTHMYRADPDFPPMTMRDLENLIRNGPSHSLRLIREEAQRHGTPMSDPDILFYRTVFNAVTDAIPLLAQYVVPDPVQLTPLQPFPSINPSFRNATNRP